MRGIWGFLEATLPGARRPIQSLQYRGRSRYGMKKQRRRRRQWPRHREIVIKRNKNKVKYSRPTHPQLGHLVISSGLKPDPDKVKAIQKIPKPEYLKGVRRVCRFVSTWPNFCSDCQTSWSHNDNWRTRQKIGSRSMPTTERPTRSGNWSWQSYSEVPSTSLPGPFCGRAKGQKALGTRLRFCDLTEQLTL